MLIVSLGKSPSNAVFAALNAFLLPFEKNCVSLVDRIRRREVSIFCILNTRREIIGVFTYSSGGQILHCIPSAVSHYSELLAILRIYFENFDLHSLFSVIGDEAGTNLLLSAIFLSTKKLPASNQSFFLMEYKVGKETAGDGLKINAVCSNGKQAVYAANCPLNLLDALLPLQEAYEREEVLGDGQAYSPLRSKVILKKSLAEKNVYAVFFYEQIVSKGAINATGQNCVQLGGIFTAPEFRKRGFAEFLIKQIVAVERKMGKHIVLFVKPKNVAALTLYKRCGFSNFGRLKISYF